MNASAHSWELIIVDDGSSDGSRKSPSPIRTRVIRRTQPRRRNRPPDRHRGSQGQCRGVVRCRHVLPESSDPTVGRCARRRRSGGGRPHVRGRHPQTPPSSGQMADPAARSVPHPDEDPRSQHRVPGVSRRGAPVHPSAAGRLQLRHHHHDGVPDERLPGRVRADRHETRQASRNSTGGKTPALRPASHPDDAVLRPAPGDAADCLTARAALRRQARLRPRRQGFPPRRQHRAARLRCAQTLAVGLLADLIVRINRPLRSVPPSDLRELS